MRKNTLILTAVLILSVFSLNAQFAIDVYYGYNYSNTDYVLPQAYNYVNYQTYFSDIPIDTIIIYHHPDTITRIVYESRSPIFERTHTKQNFATNHLYGLSVNYKYAGYFETGFSFEKIGISQQQSSFVVSIKDERYDFNDEVFYYKRATHEFNYDVINASLTQSIFYPYKRFSFYANFGLKTYYSRMHYHYTYNSKSIANEMYGYGDYSVQTLFYRKYSGYSFGFTTGLGISYNIYNDISVFVKTGYTWANIQFQKGQQMDYYNEYTNPLGKTNIESKPAPEDIALEDFPFCKINYSSWDFRLGIRYTFGKSNVSNAND